MDTDEFEETTAQRELVSLAAPAYARVPALVVVAGTDLGRVYRAGVALVIGRGEDVDVPMLDPKVSRRHAMVRVRQRVAWIEDLGSKNGTFVGGAPIERRILQPGDRIELGSTRAALKYDAFDPVELELCSRLYDSSVRDELTGAFNRRYFDERLHAEAAFAARHGAGLAVMLIELQRYEAVLDRHGSDAAERALAHVATHVRRRLRAEYALSRYGGTRFALLCPGISRVECAALESGIFAAVSESPLELQGAREPLAVRIGAAHAEGGELELADLLVARALAQLDGRSP